MMLFLFINQIRVNIIMEVVPFQDPEQREAINERP